MFTGTAALRAGIRTHCSRTVDLKLVFKKKERKTKEDGLGYKEARSVI